MDTENAVAEEQVETPEENESDPEVQLVEAAFFVIIEPGGGKIIATNDMDAFDSLRVMRQATQHDMYRAACEIKKDIETSEVAMTTVQIQMTAAHQMAEQERAQKMAAALQKKGLTVTKGVHLRR